MKAQRDWRKGFEAKCAQERGRFSTSHGSPSAFVCRVPVRGQGFMGEQSRGQSSGAGMRAPGTECLVLTTLFQGELNPSKENKYLSSFLIFNSAASPGFVVVVGFGGVLFGFLVLFWFFLLFCRFGFFFHFVYLQLEKNTGMEQSLNSLADVLLLLCPADVFSSAGVGH